MRYRIVVTQIMETMYVTVKVTEPDGLNFQTHTQHYQFDAHPDYPNDLFIILARLQQAMLAARA